MHLDYLSLRLIRRFMPQSWVRFLLKRQLIIRPGLETRAPAEAVVRYQQALKESGDSLQGRHILDFGYGGSFALACGLLQAGAGQVTLIDKFASPDHGQNQKLLPEFEKYLTQQDDQIIPRSKFITLLDGDIQQIIANRDIEPFDLILSNSVYEHLDDVAGITSSLAKLTKPSGRQTHFIDLRDHYFKYPFEMLCFSEATWKRWLNPTSNLNRLRLPDYQRTFERYFSDVKITILESDLPSLNKARSHIRPEFLTGKDDSDAATIIRADLAGPRQE
jgi:SAM-dependent methyltransferase